MVSTPSSIWPLQLSSTKLHNSASPGLTSASTSLQSFPWDSEHPVGTQLKVLHEPLGVELK